jgi:hypothetical protein
LEELKGKGVPPLSSDERSELEKLRRKKVELHKKLNLKDEDEEEVKDKKKKKKSQDSDSDDSSAVFL